MINAHNEQHFTAADMADQGARQFEAGRASVLAEQPAAAQEAVAYLDIGAGGYIDLGSDVPEDQLLALPKGRHALAIIGTYGIDGYVAAPVTAAPGIDRCSLLDIVAWWNSYTGPVDEALGEVIRRIRTLIDASPNGDHFVDATKMVQDSPEVGSDAQDAARYRWLRKHFRFANDSLRELWFDPAIDPNDGGVPEDLDQEIDRAVSNAHSAEVGE